MKKTFSLLLCIALIAGLLASCSGKKATDASSAAQAEKVTFSWLINKVEIKNELEETAAAYMAKYPHVKIITEVAGGSVEPYATRLKAKLGSNDVPALFVIEGWAGMGMFDEYIGDVSTSPLIARCNPDILSFATLNGKVRCLPMAIEGFGVIYNKTIFKKAGIDPASITSMDAMEAAAKKLTEKKAELGIDAAFCLPAKEKWIIGSQMGSAFMNGEFKTPLECFNAKTLQWVNNQSYKRFLDMQVKYGIQPQGNPKNVVNLAYADQIEKGLALGKVAMVHNGNWVSPIIRGINPEMLDNNEIGFLPIPVPGYREDCIRVAGVPLIAINAKLDDKTKAAAMAFFEWLYTSDEGKNLVVNKLGMIPPYTGFENFEIKDPLAKDLLDYMSKGKTMPTLTNFMPNGFKNYIAEKAQEYLTGKSWDEIVKETKAKWAELSAAQ